MSKWVAVPVMACIALCYFPAPTVARRAIVEDWPYDKLMKESDLAVIATAVKTEATADKPPEHSWPVEFVGQETTFKVKQAIKGKPPGEQIKVLHFKFGEPKKGVKPEDAQIIINGPLFVYFRTGGYKMSLGDSMRTYYTAPDYLLYLRALKDGRYEPVSGKINPQLAVRMLTEPDEKEQAKP